MKALPVFAALVGGAAAVSVRATNRGMRGWRGLWYRALRKPSFQPPDWAFGPVWTTLYAAMALAGARLWSAMHSPERTRALRMWGAQLALNGAWSQLFFARGRARLALAELASLTALVGATTLASARVDRPAAALLAPYAAWLGLATALNASIVRNNRLLLALR